MSQGDLGHKLQILLPQREHRVGKPMMRQLRTVLVQFAHSGKAPSRYTNPVLANRPRVGSNRSVTRNILLHFLGTSQTFLATIA